MINIYSPKDEFELAVIRGLLDSEEIQYFVFNDHFGSMRVGPQIDLFNKRSIMVAPEDVERAKAIIADVVECSQEEEIQTAPATYSFGEKLRMIAYQNCRMPFAQYLYGLVGCSYLVDKIVKCFPCFCRR